MDFPQPRHLSTTSSPLMDHDLYFYESQNYARLYDRFSINIGCNTDSRKVVPPRAPVNAVVPPSPAIIERVFQHRKAKTLEKSQSTERVILLSDHVNARIDSVDELDTEKLHPSGYVAPGWKWNSFKTPTTGKIVVDCRLTDGPLVEAPKHKIQRLLDVSSASLPHPGLNYDHAPVVSPKTLVAHSENFYDGGLIPASFPGYYCPAEYSGPKKFLNMDIYDSRGTALILPTEVNIENFLSSEIGKMFIHVQNRQQLDAAINKGLNCLVSCASLGTYALGNLPSINFNPRLFCLSAGVHCFNPEAIKIQLILLLLYYQGEILLTLFERCRWIIGSDVVELDSGGNHPT